MPETGLYKITIVNKTEQKEQKEKKAVASNQSSDNEGMSFKQTVKAIRNHMAAKYALSVIDRVITSDINTVSLRTGHEAFQRRMQYNYGIAKKGLAMLDAIGMGFVLGNVPGAFIGAVASVGNELVNIAIRQNEINVAREQENKTLFLNQIRIGASGGRMGRTE